LRKNRLNLFTFAIKERMRDTELIRAKEQALYAVYKRGLEEGRFKSFREAGEWTRKQPAPRYFIDSRTASLLLGKIHNQSFLMGLHPASRRLILHLDSKYKEYLHEHPKSTLSRERIMELLVEEPAPEFYITGEGARKIIRKVIKGIREKWGQ